MKSCKTWTVHVELVTTDRCCVGIDEHSPNILPYCFVGIDELMSAMGDSLRCISLAHSLRVMASPPYCILAHLVFFKITTKWIWTFTGGTCLLDTKINI
jgi:hypothetical protein